MEQPGPSSDAVVRRTSSRVVYRNAWMSVREDGVAYPDGTTGTYGVVDKPDFALVVPQEAGGFWLVEQYRYPVGRRCWEFPQGSWGAGASGTAEELARAELAEETGLRAGHLRRLGRLHEAPGFCSQAFDVHLAEQLQRGAPAREGTEQGMRAQWVSEQEFRRMVRDGDVVDGASLSAYALLVLDRDTPRGDAPDSDRPGAH